MARRPRKTDRTNNGFVAAARRIPTTAATGGATAVKLPRPEWQEDAWDYYDAVPEIKHAVRFVGSAMGKLRMFPAVPNPDDPEGGLVPVTDPTSGVPPEVAAVAVAEMARLRSERGGQAEILRTLATNLEVAGEGNIVGFAARPADGDTPAVPEVWEVHSVSEVTKGQGDRIVVKSSPGDARGRELTEADTLIRIWQRHPRWADLPDCALAGLLIDCEALHTLSLLVIGDANSKRNNGFLLVPNDITFGPASQVHTESDGDPDAEDDAVFVALGETIQGPIADPSSPSAVQPTLVRGPAEALQAFRHVLAARPQDATIDSKIQARVERLARGLDLPVEVVLGHRDTTYANAEQVDRDLFDDYLEPRASLMAEALAFGFLGPQLAANDSSVVREWAGRIVVDYDESGLVAEPSREANADQAHDRLVISDDAYRKVKGFGPEDAPTEEELLRRTGLRRGILTGDLTLTLLKLLGVDLQVDAPADVPIDSNGQPAPIAASSREADPPPRPGALTAARPVRATSNGYGARLLGIDQDVRARVTIAADAAMTRAIERAGNKLRNRVRRLGRGVEDTVRSVPASTVAATLGPSLAAAAGADDLLDGAWDELERQFRTWAGGAQEAALDLAGEIAAGFTAGQREALLLRQAHDLDEAWAWMKGALTSLAEGRLYSPDPLAPGIGEFDPTVSIPTGLVRQAMSRAGGATGLVTSGTDAWVAIYPDGVPPGMIATGELIGGVLADGGASVEAFVWVYGPGARRHPFEPHQDLDGVTFENFDDPVLANSDSFPGDAFYFPGDHAGCLCDFEPVIIPAEANAPAVD